MLKRPGFTSKFFLSAVFGIAVACNTLIGGQAISSPVAAPVARINASYEPDRLIILPNCNAVTQDVYEQIKEAVKDADCSLIEDPKFYWNSGIFYVKTQPGKLEDAINRLRDKAICKLVQKNWIFKPCSGGGGGAGKIAKLNPQLNKLPFDDPYRSYEWHLAACHVPAKKPNHYQPCGLIDRGLNTTLPEFAEIKKKNCFGFEEPNHPFQPASSMGDPKHATPLATTMIAALGNNKLTAGIIDYPSFFFEKAFGPADDGTLTDRDLYYAVSRMSYSFPVNTHARPVCIPFNVAPPYSLSNQDEHPILHQIMKQNHDNMNMIYFVPAGNDGKFDPNPWVPYINVVTALGLDGKILPDSNYGNNVSFTCPGENIYCSDENGQLKIGRGTSYAAAIATACTGLIISQGLDVKPGQSTASDFEKLLRQFAQKPLKGWNNKIGYGVPDCASTMDYLRSQNKGYPGYWDN